MITYKACPACGNENILQKLDALDFTVSKKSFSIWECGNCSLRFTQDVPAQHDIGGFYKSDAYVSHTDTRKGLVNKLYHLVRNITLKSKRKLLQSQTGKSKGSILDVGCGTGAFLNEMRVAGWSITGLEPDEVAVRNAMALYRISAQNPDRLFDLPKNHFDAITMWHVLEHVHQLNEYMSTLRDLLTNDGFLFIAVPNYTSFDASHYGKDWAAYDVPRHLYHFSPKSMEHLVNKHGLKLKAIKPMWFDSYYVSMLSEQIKNNKGNIIKAFFMGAVSNLNAIFNRKKCSSVIYVVGRKV